MYKASERFLAAKYSPDVKLHTFLFETVIKRLILLYKNENSKFEGCNSKIAKYLGTKTHGDRFQIYLS